MTPRWIGPAAFVANLVAAAVVARYGAWYLLPVNAVGLAVSMRTWMAQVRLRRELAGYRRRIGRFPE